MGRDEHANTRAPHHSSEAVTLGNTNPFEFWSEAGLARQFQGGHAAKNIGSAILILHPNLSKRTPVSSMETTIWSAPLQQRRSLSSNSTRTHQPQKMLDAFETKEYPLTNKTRGLMEIILLLEPIHSMMEAPEPTTLNELLM